MRFCKISILINLILICNISFSQGNESAEAYPDSIAKRFYYPDDLYKELNINIAGESQSRGWNQLKASIEIPFVHGKISGLVRVFNNTGELAEVEFKNGEKWFQQRCFF